MKITGPLIKGIFIERPNRFITRVKVDGKIIKSHLPDPGRLQELLFPGAIVYVRPAPDDSDRKTKFSTVMVESNGIFVSLDSTLPNRFIKQEYFKIPLFDHWTLIRSEYKVGNHRIDFLMEDPNGDEVFTEIKSVTFVENGIAKFPDAVTLRGKKHADLLSKLSNRGIKSRILFVCQRSDAVEFRSMWNRDPKFAKSLRNAHQQGVQIHCIKTNISLKEMTYYSEIPVNLNPPNEA